MQGKMSSNDSTVTTPKKSSDKSPLPSRSKPPSLQQQKLNKKKHNKLQSDSVSLTVKLSYFCQLAPPISDKAIVQNINNIAV